MPQNKQIFRLTRYNNNYSPSNLKFLYDLQNKKKSRSNEIAEALTIGELLNDIPENGIR